MPSGSVHVHNAIDNPVDIECTYWFLQSQSATAEIRNYIAQPGDNEFSELFNLNGPALGLGALEAFNTYKLRVDCEPAA